MRMFVGLIIVVGVLTACIPDGVLPGSIETETSKFDNRKYVRAEPGWVSSLEQGTLDGLFGGPFKIGAIIHSEVGAMLLARVDDITRITGVEIMVDGITHKLERSGLTEFTLSSESRFDITHSESVFSIDTDLLRQLVSGTGTAWMRVSTGSGYLEGDFGETCSSQWSDWACVAIRNALAEAEEIGLTDQ